MRITDLLSRIEALPRATPGEIRPPPPEIIAFFVIVTRRFRKWKKSALANIAGVSISTLERIERGEPVETASLEKIEKAFGLEPGYITSPRAPLTQEEMAAYFERHAKIEYVDVSPLKSQPQVRELAECHGFLPLSNVPQLDCGDEVHGLLEWLDLASFIRSDDFRSRKGEKSSLRELYTSILDHVKGMEQQGYNVLAGVLNHAVAGIPDWKYAVIYVSSKRTDPGGSKRQFVPVDTSAFPRNLTMADCAQWIDDD